MSGRPHFASVSIQTDVPESGNNTETVFATLVGVVPEVPSQAVKLNFTCTLTLGASSTGGTFRFRRGALTGSQVGESLVMTGLAVAVGSAEDIPGEGIFTYVVTYQGTGDTGVATVLDSTLTARWD
jgi:hypothetical protein